MYKLHIYTYSYYLDTSTWQNFENLWPCAVGPPRHSNVNLNMGWLRWVGSLKLWVSFSKRALYNRRYSATETYDFKWPTNRSLSKHSNVNLNIDDQYVTWLIEIFDMTHPNANLNRLPMCDVTHQDKWHDSSPCPLSLFQAQTKRVTLMWHDSSRYVTWPIQMPLGDIPASNLNMCVMTHRDMWHDSSKSEHVTRVWHDSSRCHMSP